MSLRSELSGIVGPEIAEALHDRFHERCRVATISARRAREAERRKRLCERRGDLPRAELLTHQHRDVPSDRGKLRKAVRLRGPELFDERVERPNVELRVDDAADQLELVADVCSRVIVMDAGKILADGTELSPALGIGAFCDKTLVAAGQCTRVDPAAKPEAAGLLGCGVMAGLGAAINTAEIRPGTSVCVIGCGGVGIAAIQGARIAGAAEVVAACRREMKFAISSRRACRSLTQFDTCIANRPSSTAVRELNSA